LDGDGEDATSRLQCEVSVVHFKWIKGETGWIKSKVCSSL